VAACGDAGRPPRGLRRREDILSMTLPCKGSSRR
jgi:hypothetical protein